MTAVGGMTCGGVAGQSVDNRTSDDGTFGRRAKHSTCDVVALYLCAIVVIEANINAR